MKKNLLLSLIAVVFFVSGYSQTNKGNKTKITAKSEVKATSNSKNLIAHKEQPTKETIALRKSHANFLKNSPFKKTLLLSEDERIENGIPPNKYFESEWELTINPKLGRPTSENLAVLREQLEAERKQALLTGRTPGDASDNNWVERGPTNVGGRTRAIMFDPNDATKETVFAGGVSGGLWKNTAISNAGSSWTRVNIPDNLNVSSIVYDPNNSSIFYAGTGESYTSGDAGGDGVWKSTNAGLTWTKVFGGISGATTAQTVKDVTINSPAGIAGDYVGIEGTSFGTKLTSPLTKDIVLVIDNTAPTSDGCETITNAAALSGKIALIRRGTCSFAIKVKAAQVAGALGVIMMNNQAGGPISMGGTDATITIPSIMISQADGDILETALASGIVNGTMNPTPAGQFTGNLVPGIQHVNDMKVRNNAGVSEIYVAAGDSFYQFANSATYQGSLTFGLWKSVNGGTSWTNVNLPLAPSGNKSCPNDIAIGSDNKIWVSTTDSSTFGDGGGKVFSSTDGITFTQKYAVTGGGRVQIAASSTTSDKLYVLSEITPASGTIETTILGTTDGFTTAPTVKTLPTSAEGGRTTTYGFTGQQAFYDLMIEVDPSNDQNVYVGGIDIFRSANGGTSWSQITSWNSAASVSPIHSDIHAMTFKPGASNIALFGCDGGISYASTLSGASTSTTAISTRNTGLNITQFYSLGVAPSNAVSGLTNDYIVAGAQDNGSQYFASVTSGANSSVAAQGGDGAFSMFDQGADKYYITNYVYNNSINYKTTAGATRVINSETTNNGAFIAPMTLDSNLDLLYSDYSLGAVFQVRKYNNLKSGIVGKTLLTNALLTSSATALTVSKYTTASTTLLLGCRNGKLLKVTTANATGVWTDITGAGFVGSISDVEFGTSESQIFVTMHNYGVVSVWYSADSGVTWQNKEGNLPDLPVKCVLLNPLNTSEVIIGTELGVWYTNTFANASPTWLQSYNGMSNVKVTDLDLRNDNAVYAATYGRGVFSGTFTAVALSTNNVENSRGAKVYPNPSNGQFNLRIENFTGKVNIQLVDVNGRVVYNADENNFNTEKSINTNSLQAGIYILNVKGDDLNYTEKVIMN